MEITVTETDRLMDTRDIYWEAGYFVTPEDISETSIKDVGWIDTIFFRRMHCFTSGRYTYLIFYDDGNLEPKDVIEGLRSCRDISDPRGHLCEARDGSDSVYGVSQDHDPFRDGYTYLWCCDTEEDLNSESRDMQIKAARSKGK